MIGLSLGQQKRLMMLCQNNSRPPGIPQQRWDDLREGSLTTLNEIDQVVLIEALGSEFSRAMKRSQDELRYMRRREGSHEHSLRYKCIAPWQPPKPLPGYTKKFVNEAWLALIHFPEQQLSEIAEMDGTYAEEIGNRIGESGST